ncbi:MAG: hypothetical protein N2423_05080, partial [Novosphingobium sp.]|nr:hypothetical protein [Novosphingobium sp.]
MTAYSDRGAYSTYPQILPLTSATLFVSAFLLFSVQPFFTKLVLPFLGGAPGVWSVAMVFFQSVLLAGYAYAHLLTSRVSLRSAVLLHTGVMLAALACLPIAMPENWTSVPANGETTWLIGLFASAVGLPFFALSANGPLLQAWFALSGHRQAKDPYFLYRASNIGSFAALFAYVLLVEPFLDLKTQSTLWTAGFGFLCCSIAVTGYLAWRMAGQPRPEDLEGQPTAINTPDRGTITWHDRLVWVGLAFLPSALLVAVTAHISTDIAAMPFLWILPLALFLLTFIIAFGQHGDWWHQRTSLVLPLLIVALIFFTVTTSAMPIFLTVLLHAGTFFFAALHCHLLLAKRRPAARQLTQFYFALSIGGVLGGIFSGLLAPRLFDWNAEYLLLMLAMFMTLDGLVGKSLLRFSAVTGGVTLAVISILVAGQMLTSGALY